jgi:LmbE family N-acetylglucosaminyl deacetylase
MNNTYKTLVISPHCDDEVLACGGILDNRKRYNNTFVYYIGVDLFHIVKREIRLEEVKAVASFLNFDYIIGKNTVNAYKKELIINEITDIINYLKPEEVFIPNGAAYNQDHKEVYSACIIALRPHDLNHFVPNVFVYEVDQYLLWGENMFEPNYFEAINVENKIKAYELYKSQVRSFRPSELIRSYSFIKGLSCQLKYAEAFKTMRGVKCLKTKQF